MRLESLQVIHLSKLNGAGAVPCLSGEYFYLETCQRRLWVFLAEPRVLRAEWPLNNCDRQARLCDAWRSKRSDQDGSSPFRAKAVQDGQFDFFSGEKAYAFLLKLLCGLESQVAGETEIVSQVKEAWKKFGDATAFSATLSPWMQKCFEDMKEIRSEYLQNLGSVSYGSLVRKLIGEKRGMSPGANFIASGANPLISPTPAIVSPPLLLLGAGGLAWSVAPWLLDQELWIWNRTFHRAEMLRQSLLEKNKFFKDRKQEGMGTQGTTLPFIRTLESDAEELDAWQHASHVVCCVPFDSGRDAARLRAWQQGRRDGLVIHLGGDRAQSGPWQNEAQFVALDDLYALQRSNEKSRAEQLAQAARACDEKALMRGFVGTRSIPLTFPYGWEDLPVWA